MLSKLPAKLPAKFPARLPARLLAATRRRWPAPGAGPALGR